MEVRRKSEVVAAAAPGTGEAVPLDRVPRGCAGRVPAGRNVACGTTLADASIDRGQRVAGSR